MMTVSSILVSLFINQKYTKGPFLDCVMRKKKRKRRPWWREKTESTVYFTFILFIVIDLTSASSHGKFDISCSRSRFYQSIV